VWPTFRGATKPDISVAAYMARIAEYANDCSPSCFVAAYIYLDGHGALAVVDSYSLDVDETTYVRICLVE
jgi:hypothetical protein